MSLAKRRGFIYPDSEIYGGMSGFWDFGPLGVELKNNIKKEWWRFFVSEREDMFGLESSIIMNPKVWEASGHAATFNDPMVECKKCNYRERIDLLIIRAHPGEALVLPIDPELQKKFLGKCPNCGEQDWDNPKQFNLMFKTFVGSVEDSASTAYLRPETAQGMFVNFKNIVDSFHPKLPFGLAQIGKAFRNEITPGNFIFRLREFEQMEIEYFISATDKWEKWFENWLEKMCQWLNFLGFKKENIFEREVSEKDRAHYSKRTVDIDYDFPFGQEELCGLAYRGDFDLKAHGLDYQDNEEVGPPQGGYAEEVRPPRGGRTSIIIPHVIEPTFGVERIVLALLCENYDEDTMNGEKRIVLRINPKLAPVKAAVFPLLANKPELVKKAREVFEMLKKEIPQTNWDDIGNIGKRYRRQDEIGTPFCLTIDFDTLKDETLTIRARDTGQQERVAVSKVIDYIKERL
ncbi:MAG: Glycine-tRNA ligase [Parcubacteria group bacterium GW2011_GWB1_41_6]|nr:MAG: Glycine-tRNA ligase [Parcubacteria group bacterium GW2011_GWB1_41_6]KKS34695.1 MAG: Glycine-tRNA ligase [Parcubacteria group bacterium GW2011_GWC2_42_13]KKS58309.1 MAG: Glycine-tRNA ligase [Parcubacteria group bacterium GW2011_GWA2_42_35]KKS73330.1 MAG: Glycine-tRNA ligase [Parcubacteria group bacterium GW2011_GWF2_42_7]